MGFGWSKRKKKGNKDYERNQNININEENKPKFLENKEEILKTPVKKAPKGTKEKKYRKEMKGDCPICGCIHFNCFCCQDPETCPIHGHL